MQVISLNTVYASGARRFAAWVIDALIISIVIGSTFPFHFTGFFGAKFIAAALYFAIMESSNYQATIGKMAMGIKVTDLNGNRLEFGKALLRNLSKIISTFVLCIGYIMIVFDERKQGLHDKIADTYVVR